MAFKIEIHNKNQIKMKTKSGVEQELFYTKPMQENINLERAAGGVWL